MTTTKPRHGCRACLPAFLLTTLFASPGASAAGFDLWLESSRDDAGIDTAYAELGIILDSGLRLQLGGGRTDYNDNGASIDPVTFTAGIAASPNAFFSPGLRLENWRAEGVMETSTLRLDLDFNLDDWTLRATPQFKDITLRVTPLIGSPFDVSTDGKGLELGAAWYGLEDWSLGIVAGTWDYARDFTRLNTRRAARFFSEQTLTSSSALLDRWFSASATRYTGWGAWGLSWGVTTSAVTLGDARTLAVNFTWDLSHDIGLYMEAGRTRLDDGGDIDYSRLALTLSW